MRYLLIMLVCLNVFADSYSNEENCEITCMNKKNTVGYIYVNNYCRCFFDNESEDIVMMKQVDEELNEEKNELIQFQKESNSTWIEVDIDNTLQKKKEDSEE